jgi:hypothetical protein
VSIGDSGNDQIDNYNYSRENGTRPVIAYNPRSEKRSKQDQIERGYDANGYPFAPCGLPTRPNGFCESEQRVCFCCARQCEKMPHLLEQAQHCPHRFNKMGFSTHMSIKEHPRLILEYPRGSAKYQKVYGLRSGSERANSTAKADKHVLEHPRVMGFERSAILSQMAAIVVLLKRLIYFICNINQMFKQQALNTGQPEPDIFGPEIPDFIFSILCPQQE